MMKKRILGWLLTICLLIAGIMPASYAKAVTTTCNVYPGSNVESQDYSRCSSPITSYLADNGNGELMRVQYGYQLDNILVEYYDSSYNLLRTKMVDQELPTFGGFYETDTNYFLLTGQSNKEQAADVEGYRITKYDKNWNRITSVGLYDCNTVYPFDAGSARMDVWGKYLLIRTSHEMYSGHQANVTIQVDMDTMEITDSYTTVSNNSNGYVSHSFNQFIKIEDGKIVSVDHGDAYPRSIVLLKYQTDVSTGKFVPNWGTSCKSIHVLKFPGATGENYTGASVGGFEISETSYLVAGNSVVQDDKNLTRRTRNIFVASVEKTASEVKMNWLTSYAEGDGTTSTPQMVKISDDRYIILWSRDNRVYYTEINGDGKQVGATYHMPGSLSDCVPIVMGDKLVWYTWEDAVVTFYDINLQNLDQTNVTLIENGHRYENKGVIDGYAKLVCSLCGDTKDLKVMTDMEVWWNENGGQGYYYPGFEERKKVGDELHYFTRTIPDDADVEVETIVSDPNVISYTPENAWSGFFTMINPGKTTITIRPKWNPAIEKTYTVEVIGDEVPITSIALNKEKLELKEGTSEQLKVTYNPENTTDEKKVSWKSNAETVAKVGSDGTVTAVSSGTATITATTKNGKTASCVVTVTKAVDKKKLEEAIRKYESYKESDYVSGWEAFEKALEAAKKVNETATASQEEVNQALEALEKAAEKLEAKRPIISIELNKEKLELKEGKSEQLKVTYNPENTTDEKKVSWKSNAETVAKVGSDGTVTAISSGTATITATTKNRKTASCVVTVTKAVDKPLQVSYRTHVQNVGWQSYVTDGQLSGTSGKGLRLEGIAIRLENNNIGGGIEYRTHVQNIGWQPYVAEDQLSGTSGKSLRLEAIQIRLTGAIAEKYDVYYRTHIQDKGWLGWAKNDGKSGSSGISKRLEAIQIRLVKKGESAPGTTENAYITNQKVANPSIIYKTHVQNMGWQDWVKESELSGTSGQGLRLEAIRIRVDGDGLNGGIEYSTHVENVGWQPYVTDDKIAGTSGRGLRLEGIKIRLTGELANEYQVEYRTHVENVGWQSWVKDDTISGTTGRGLRLEAIEIRLVKK